ncbi:hypothetical protein KEM54_001044 [Ascosphaera aggregata]|nr:hypothetical protein KEM54_001044 [Ascosphaera aggregata]
MDPSSKSTTNVSNQRRRSVSGSPSDQAVDTMIHHDLQDSLPPHKGKQGHEMPVVDLRSKIVRDESRGEISRKRSRSVHPSNASREINKPLWRLKSYGHEEDQNLALFYADSRRIFDEYDAWVAGHEDEHRANTYHEEHSMRQPSCQHNKTGIARGKTALESVEADTDAIDKIAAVHAYNALKPTVMEWTSPNTRRREYAKIDKSTRGIRGFWRRFAPACCQASSAPVPFYDGHEVKKKKGKGYEGSVRRFRMDVEEEDGLDDEFVHAHDVKEVLHSLISRLSQVESTLSTRWQKITEHNDMKRGSAMMRDQEKFCY